MASMAEKTPESTKGQDEITVDAQQQGSFQEIDLKGHGQLDAAAEYLRVHAEEYGGFTEAEAKKVLWKVDIRIIPILLLIITFAAVDKIVISNAALYGMRKDTHLVGNLYSWTGSIFYFGYLVSEYPANMLIQKLPVAKFMGITTLAWSALVMLMGTTHNAPGLMTLRFFMGVLEAPIFPCCSIITVMWYKKSEQPIRTAIWFSGFSSVFTGVISYGIGHTHTSVAPWRLLFIVLGAFTFLLGIIILIFLPDSPVKNRFLNDREKFIAVSRIKENMTGTENREIKWYQIKETLLDWKTWPLVIFSICLNVPNGGLVTFAAQIVSGLGYSPLQTTLLGIPTGIMMTLPTWILAYPASRLKNMRCVIAATACLIPMVCCILMMELPKSNKTGLLAAYYCFYTYWTPYATVISLPFANTSGHTKKTTTNALMFAGYCIANIIAPQFFITSEAPGYRTGYRAILACLSIGIVAVLVYGAGMRWENAKREKIESERKEEGADVESEKEKEMLSDLTDREKVYFRYTY